MGKGTGSVEPKSYLDIPKEVTETWVEIPKEVDMAIFLDGRKFINPKDLQQVLKTIKDFRKRK